MKTYSLLNLLMNDQTTYDYKLVVKDAEGNDVTLYDTSDFKTMIMNKYTSFFMLCPRYYDDDAKEMVELIADRDAAITYLHNIYDLWKKDKLPGFEKMYQAIRMDYNPIWNVDGVEGFVSKDTHTGTDIMAHKGKDTTLTEDNGNITKTGSETIATTGSDTSTDSNTTYDSASFYDNNKNVLQHGATDTHTYNSVRDNHDLDGKNETTYNSSNEQTKNLTDNHVDLKVRQGNIGVTMTQQLEEAEMKFRMNWDNLIDMIIKDFVHKNMILL